MSDERTRLRALYGRLRRERDDALAVIETRNAEIDLLRSIIEGRSTPPTDAELAAHEAAGGRWRCVVPSDPVLSLDGVGRNAWLQRGILNAAGLAESSRWWPLDAAGRPCAWPVAPANGGAA
jgi:hypothetical protein